ncbi:hypothetical protein ACIRQY_25545 [Streptomyces sp. NPDC101490]|uniref:hypothetical protein n=1 Tax=Streptomyces sp. NPDC101490 TaxID=3366143 RepID=UPI0038146D29
MQPPVRTPAPVPGPSPAPLPGAASDVLHDRGWPGEARAAAVCAGLLLGTSLGVDAGAYGLPLSHTLGWIALSALLFVVLLPARVSLAPGLLTARGLWVTRTVRTDLLTAVAWPTGTARRLRLRDGEGGWAEVDLRVLLDNPALWLRIESAALSARRRGTLVHGTADLARLALRVDTETTRAVLNSSGLE